MDVPHSGQRLGVARRSYQQVGQTPNFWARFWRRYLWNFWAARVLGEGEEAEAPVGEGDDVVVEGAAADGFVDPGEAKSLPEGAGDPLAGGTGGGGPSDGAAWGGGGAAAG